MLAARATEFRPSSGSRRWMVGRAPVAHQDEKGTGPLPSRFLAGFLSGTPAGAHHPLQSQLPTDSFHPLLTAEGPASCQYMDLSPLPLSGAYPLFIAAIRPVPFFLFLKKPP